MMAKPIPYDDDDEPEQDERDMRKIVLYDDEALNWADKRDAFVTRHMAQVKAHGEPLWKDGLPTRRHLALIMWAYSPSSSKLSKI